MTKQLSQKKILIYIYLLNETSNTSTLSGFARAAAGNAFTNFHEALSTACTLINIGKNSPVITNLHTKKCLYTIVSAM